MKRSWVLLICLLLALLLVPVAWKLAAVNAAGSRASSKGSSSSTESGDSMAAGSDEGKASRRPTDFAAKAKSMLELRAGELGILPIPADFVADVVVVPGESAAELGVPLVRGMMSKTIACQLLEKALRQGATIQGKVGSGAEGIAWKGEKIDISARLENAGEGFPELRIESSEDGGTTTKMAMQLAAGTCAVVRYPSGRSVLVVIGKSLPTGEVTEEGK
ncbi:hypothetical protein [Haloferula sp. BvORR071]|uniref:hypothetical protein n=1 Tax=Haloferula sp. BvORR071 TaxID=1396141 RepID=UPI002240F6E3|nr:hypothetical protein [Haloferula sp. BvORR071]